MKTIIVLLSLVMIGCSSSRVVHSDYIAKDIPEYKIGAYTPPEDGEYGFKKYNANTTREFLASVWSHHEEGRIISVDGLKWQKFSTTWKPYPNPPMPVLEAGENVRKHTKEYSHWVNTHPHFGYPPLPLINEK